MQKPFKSFFSTAVSSISSFVSNEKVSSDVFKVCGWVRSVRMHKQVSFLVIQDGTTMDPLQVVLPTEVVKPIVASLGVGASVSCVGTRSISKHGKIDMTSNCLNLIGSSSNLPVQKKESSTSFLRQDDVLQHRHRSQHMQAILRLRSSLGNEIHNFLQKEGHEWISTPILTSNDCEGAGELFPVSYVENTPTFLTVSGQLHSEIFVSGGFSKVYTFGPTFRAENSHTTKHLCEFWMVEPEMAFSSCQDAQLLCERMIKRSVHFLWENRPTELQFLHAPKPVELDTPFCSLSYSEAKTVLESKGGFVVSNQGLSTPQERYLVETFTNGVPLFVTHFPSEAKPFYCLLNEDTQVAENFDLLVPGIGELVGGSAREHRFDVLKERMTRLHLLPQLKWYLDLREFGTTPHAGFGVGFERLLQWISGVENIRDVSPIPRFPGSIRM